MKWLESILESVRKYSRRKVSPPPLPPPLPTTTRKQPPKLPPPLPPAQQGKKQPDILKSQRIRLVQSGGAARFIYEGEEMGPISSNVEKMRYDVEKGELTVEYKGGATWVYGEISEQEALWAWDSGSKGVFVWDMIRVRGKGNKHKHKKPAKQIK